MLYGGFALNKHLKADLSLLAMVVIWGSSFILMKNTLDFMPPFAYLSLRFSLAAAVLIGVLFRQMKAIKPKDLGRGAICGALVSSYMGLQVLGLLYTTVAKSSLITGMSVIMVPILSAFILKKAPNTHSIVGVALAAIGMISLSEFSFSAINIGDIMTFGCAVLCAIHILMISHFSEKTDPRVLSVLQCIVCALSFSIMWGLTGFGGFEFNLSVLIALLVTGVFGTSLAYTVWAVVQKDTTPTKTALIFSSEPVFAIIFALLIPNNSGNTEPLTLFVVAGCTLIVTGMLVAELKA